MRKITEKQSSPYILLCRPLTVTHCRFNAQTVNQEIQCLALSLLDDASSQSKFSSAITVVLIVAISALGLVAVAMLVKMVKTRSSHVTKESSERQPESLELTG